MKKLAPIALATLLTAPLAANLQAEDDLVYVAVDPCRVADTRKTGAGPIKAGAARNFRVSGTANQLASQGGQVECPNPREGERPVAVAAYILAVPANTSNSQGVLSAYPSDQPPPPAGSGSTVNFDLDQVIGNTTITTLCSTDNCPGGAEMAVLARVTNEHVVIDVQGYFYPQKAAPGYVIVEAPFAVGNRDSVLVQATCPDGKKVLGGGGNLVDSTWFMERSYPLPDGSAWRVGFKSSGQTFSAAGAAYAICASVD